MDDKEVVKIGKRCAKLFSEAWELRHKIDEEVVKRAGFKSVEDFEDKTGLDFENDSLIDALDMGGGNFTMKDWKIAIRHQKGYIHRHSHD